jgi:transposase InsO family protein
VSRDIVGTFLILEVRHVAGPLVITSVTLDGRSKSEVAREYGVVPRVGAEAGAPLRAGRSGRLRTAVPKTSLQPRAVSLEVDELIIRLRKTLTTKGVDAGAETIAAHLQGEGVDPLPAVSTIWRILSRRGFVVSQPQKRPRSSWRRFCADQPNERWQADITHWRLADGSEVEILNILDDHPRVCIASAARRVSTGVQVWASFAAAFDRWGIPAEVLTDNAAVFTGKQRGLGRVALEVQLGLGGVRISHSRPYHPQTCGKVERFHQTMKKWLTAQSRATGLAMLQRQLDRFTGHYNTTGLLEVARRVGGPDRGHVRHRGGQGGRRLRTSRD